MKQWFEDVYWHFRSLFYYRFDLEDEIDRKEFFYELNYGWHQMRDEYLMSQPNFDPYNLSGRDPYYSYMLRKK